MPSAAVNLRTQLLMFHLLPAAFILNGHLTADERRYTQRALTTRLPASLTQSDNTQYGNFPQYVH